MTQSNYWYIALSRWGKGHHRVTWAWGEPSSLISLFFFFFLLISLKCWLFQRGEEKPDPWFVFSKQILNYLNVMT